MGRFLRRVATGITAEISFRTGRFLHRVATGITAEISFRTGQFLRPAAMEITAETFSSRNSTGKNVYSGFPGPPEEVGVWL